MLQSAGMADLDAAPAEPANNGSVSKLGKLCSSTEGSDEVHCGAVAAERAGPPPPHQHPEALAHAARLMRHSVEMIEERVEAMEQHKLAPEPELRPAKPLKSMLRNLWVLAIMGAIVGIIVASTSRIHVAEPLQGVHATNGAIPYVMALDSTSVNYLYVNLMIGPYFPPDASSGGSSGGSGHRRRLAAWVGEAVSLQAGQDLGFGADVAAGASLTSGALPAGVAPHPLVTADAHAELVRRVKKLLSKPKLVLPQRRQHRRLLTADVVQEPADAPAEENEMPQLRVTLMQRNASAAPAPAPGPASAAQTHAEEAAAAVLQAASFFPVSEPQYCTTKEGAAVKCSMSFGSGDFTSAWQEGQPLYLGFEATQLTQVVFKSEVSELGGLGPAKNWLALAILGAVLVGIASEKVHRMWCAMIGAAFMMSLLLWMGMPPSLAMVVEWLDESTLGLLFGMMIIVGRLKDTARHFVFVFDLLGL